MRAVPRRWQLFALVLAGSALVYVAGLPPVRETPAAGAALRYGVDVDAMSLDPRTVRNTTDTRIVDLLYDGLVRLDSSLNPQPSLALSWQQPDPLTLVFNLRADAHFADGTPVTADDVAFTYRSILDPTQHSSFASLLSPISEVTAQGEHQVKFTLSKPFAPLLRYLEIGIVPRHLVEAGVDLATAPLGSGRYRFIRWERGTRILLAPNPEHPGVATTDPPVEFLPVPDNTARAQAVEAHDLDIVAAPLAAADIRRLSGTAGLRHHRSAGLKITYLNFNVARGPLADVNMRRAIALLVDRKAISAGVFGGTETPADSTLLPSLAWSYSPTIQQPAFDPDKAQRVLLDDGWRRDKDGFLAKDGQRLTLTISTHSEDAARIQAAEYIQHALSAAGFDARVSIADFPAFIGRVRQGQYEIALLGWDNIVDPDQLLYEKLRSQGDLNWGSYSNARLDSLLLEARSSAEPSVRASRYQQAAALLAEQLPYLVLTYAGFDAFSDARADAWQIDARGFLTKAPSVQ